MAKNKPHIGENIRAIRQLKGVKQEVLAKKLGIAQQNVSKMEKKEKVSQKKLEEAAKVLGVTVETIKKFNEKAIINNNLAFGDDNQVNHFNPVQEIISYFKDELSKKDTKIEELQERLNAYERGEKPGNGEGETANGSQSKLTAVK